MKAKPLKRLAPLQIATRFALARRQKAKAKVQSKEAAKVRANIYQDITALIDIADRLTLDFSSHEDRYGLEWYALAKQINAHYKAAVAIIIPGLRAMIMSKEGAQGLPKVLYRNLLDFAGECVEFMTWARSSNFDDSADAQSAELSAKERPESQFTQACNRFKKACLEMQKQICIFENERGAGEESFFG